MFALGGAPLIPVGGVVPVEFTIVDPMPNSVFKLFLVVDNDVSEIALVAENLTSGSVEHFISLSSYSLSVGPHLLSFYVVNEMGFVSSAANVQINLILGATSTPAQSPTLTQSPVQSQSRAAWPSPSPFATSYPIGITWPTDANFDINWHSNGDVSTTYGAGYSTTFRVGEQGTLARPLSILLLETSDIFGGQPVTIGGVTIETIALELSAYAI